MKSFVLDLLLWVLASPILLLRGVIRGRKHIRFWTMSYTPHIPCRSCGAPVSLVGIFRCGCGYTSRSHLLRRCPICHSLPRVVRCGSCSVTQMLPEEP